MAYIHASCLFESRVNSLDPRTISECGLCKTSYRTVDTHGLPQDSQSAQRELYLAFSRYLVVRVGGFCACVIAMGFLPWLLASCGVDVQFLDSMGFEAATVLPVSLQGHGVVPHLGRGLISTLACAGGWAVIHVSEQPKMSLSRLVFSFSFANLRLLFKKKLQVKCNLSVFFNSVTIFYRAGLCVDRCNAHTVFRPSGRRRAARQQHRRGLSGAVCAGCGVLGVGVGQGCLRLGRQRSGSGGGHGSERESRGPGCHRSTPPRRKLHSASAARHRLVSIRIARTARKEKT